MGSLVQAHPEAQKGFGLSPPTKVVVFRFAQAAKPEQAHPEAQSPAKRWAFLLGFHQQPRSWFFAPLKRQSRSKPILKRKAQQNAGLFFWDYRRPSFLLCPKQGSVGCLTFCLKNRLKRLKRLKRYSNFSLVVSFFFLICRTRSLM